jgi:hypothetical protein
LWIAEGEAAGAAVLRTADIAAAQTSVLDLHVPRTVVDQGHVHGSRANARGNEIEPRAFALDRRGLAQRGTGESGSANPDLKRCLGDS